EVEAARAAADDRLPDLDRMNRPRHQRELFQLIATIRHLRRQRVVLAMVREGLLAKRLEDDFDLLLEEIAVGLGIQHRRAERLDLARVIAAAHAEYEAA